MRLVPPLDAPPQSLVPPGAPQPGVAGFTQAWDSMDTFVGQALPALFGWFATFNLIAERTG